jgi:hypothetical protein
MHKDSNADNTPIGWIKMYLGLDLMLQKVPITVLSARLNIKRAGKQKEADVLPMGSSHT